MDSPLLGWPLILGSFGLVFGLIVGMALLSIFEIQLLAGPNGPAVGGIVGFAIGLYLEGVGRNPARSTG